MIPLRDTQSLSRTPIICYGLIGAMLLIFIGEIRLEIVGELQDWVAYWSLVPAEIIGLFQEAIATQNPAIWTFLFWRIFAIVPALFIHSSYAQILGNLIFLFAFGRSLEDRIGRGYFLLFFVASGLITSGFRVALDPDMALPIIGANSAIAALLGAYIILIPQAKIDSILPLLIVFIPVKISANFYLLWWFIQQSSYGIGMLNINVNAWSVAGIFQQGLAIILGMAIAYFWLKPIAQLNQEEET
ncbi:rhomboid family intramembrane serine protease [Roseofilum casamattae]|uniref:Rhomboid family intramembrane serine protease n=1 Tax=Roseofilum casamattae BLCC-M143 TaxID=3022442 RepID=A0ABT7C2W3_9CYAN|nr:rhomboid family intramembrane serine protease [Roseofilum casamattae]MDJ1185784.1 rhomboid family intramembrane serine protease [Roseofilum casamattae BLCC-M143]